MKTKVYQFTLALMVFFIFIESGRAEESADPAPFPEMRKNKIDIFKKCKFIFNNAPKGDYYKWPESADVLIRLWPNVAPLQVSLFCHSRSDKESLEMELGAKQVNGKWQPAGGREKGCDPKKSSQTVICEFISNVPFIPEQHMRAISLSGINWQGVGILTDETTGEERWRKRELRYCLFHVEIALCGQVFVRNLMKPHHDVLSIVLKVLNSIEFVDDVSRNPSETPLR